VFKIFAFLELEQKLPFFKGLILIVASRLWILDNHNAFQQVEVFFMTAFRWAMIAGGSVTGASVVVAFLREP